MKTLEFSTYLGGAGNGYAQSVAVDAQGYAHATGSVGFGLYTTPGAAVSAVPQPATIYSGETFPFVALISAGLPGPALCAAPNNQLMFGAVALNGFAEESLNLTNCGTQPLTVTSVSSAAGPFTVPASGNTCTQSLPPGQSCMVVVRYTPTAVQNDDLYTLSIVSNAAEATQSLALQGSGALAPFITLAPGALTFLPQLVGTSAAQTVTLTNSGSAAATSLAIQLLQTSPALFQETTTCGVSLAVGASCTANISFTPQSAGNVAATLSVQDFTDGPITLLNYPIAATGSTAGFSVVAASMGGSTATVSAGQTASYALTFSNVSGYAGTVAFTCGSLPQNATCTVSPASLAATSAGSRAVTVTIGTQVTQAAKGNSISMSSGEMLAIVFAPLLLWRKRQFAGTCALLLFTLTLFNGCGGGSGGGSTGTPKPATVAPGTYTVQLTASDGKNTQTQNLTLIVQ